MLKNRKVANTKGFIPLENLVISEIPVTSDLIQHQDKEKDNSPDRQVTNDTD